MRKQKKEHKFPEKINDLKYGKITYLELNELVEKQAEKVKGNLFLFLDEVQKVDKWKLTVNSLKLKKNIDIYITSSNAYLLSSQLSTYLSGRYVEIKMQPLTFKEFLTFYDLGDINIDQFCETLYSEETRELKPLQNIKDNYEKIILTKDNIFVNTDDNGIKILNVIDWLLV